MILRHYAVTLLALFAFALTGAYTQSGETPGSNTQMVVDADWLRQHINDPSLILLHVGDKATYEQSHIPGAQLIQISEISTPRGEGLTLELPPVDQLKNTFEQFGISNSSRVIIYFGKDWVSPTARVFFTLDYIGMGGHTSILDGGMDAWIESGGGVTNETQQPARGLLTPHPRNNIVVTTDWLNAHLTMSRIAIVDSRTPEFYDGSNPGSMPRAGHIPGATSILFNTLGDSLNRVLGVTELKKIFVDAGINPDDTVITYCHIGQQASFGYFVARYLGYNVRLYDGSFEDWSPRTELPVVNLKEQKQGN